MKNKRLKSILKKIYFLPGGFANRFLLSLKGVSIGKHFWAKGHIHVINHGKIKIGDDVRIRSGWKSNPIGCGERTLFRTLRGGVIAIGNGSALSNTTIVCKTEVTIGHHVMLGGGVKIFDTDFHELNPVPRMQLIEMDECPYTKTVILKDFCFIGADSIILKGSCIGEQSVIGAGSVVSGNVPDYEVWGGNPARFIRKLNDDERYVEDDI